MYTYVRTYVRTDGRADGWTAERKDELTDGRTDRRTNERTNERKKRTYQTGRNRRTNWTDLGFGVHSISDDDASSCPGLKTGGDARLNLSMLDLNWWPSSTVDDSVSCGGRHVTARQTAARWRTQCLPCHSSSSDRRVLLAGEQINQNGVLVQIDKRCSSFASYSSKS